MQLELRIYDKIDYFITDDPGHFFVSPDGTVFDVNDGLEITNRVILMVGTGVRDKLGRKIWQGDIFEYKMPSFQHGSVIERGIVEYSEHGEWVVNGKQLSRIYSLGMVIGDAYQHSELLSPTDNRITE